MKFSLVLDAALLAAASATSIEPRAVAEQFDVTGFSAGCVPHGTLCTFSFYVATDQMPAQTNCNATFTTAYTLPNVPTTACVDTSISWSFNAVDSGANYTLILIDFQQGLAASKVWDKADFPTIDAGSTVYQQYIGTPSFVVV